MPDSTVATLPADLPASEELLQVLLNISQTGLMVLRPVYEADGTTIIDLAWVHLNPAAQQMLQLAARPTESFLTLFPTALAAGVFGFYRDAFLSGQVERRQNNYQHDGLDGYYLLVAQRQGEVLLVSFTDTNDRNRTAIEEELRTSQARELEARAEAELQRQQLHLTLYDAPAMICVFEGPRHVFQFVNPPYQALVGPRPLLGIPIAEAMPELAGQPIFALLDHVYQTGETFRASEMLVQLDHDNVGPQALEKRYYNFVYQARHSAAGAIDGIFVFAYDVTPQVLARHQVQDLNEELAATNEELHAANEEYLRSNTELLHTQQTLQQRNHDLHHAQGVTEQERQHLYHLFMQAPAAICILHGPELVYELVNPGYQNLFPGRVLLSRPLLDALPELTGHPVWDTLQRVYRTGETHIDQRVHLRLAPTDDAPLADYYFNYTFQPRYDAAGQPDGVLVFAFDVTAHVQAQQHAKQLNNELEMRVAERTRQLQEQQALLRQILGQVPASIATLSGPEHRFSFTNDHYRRLVGERAQLGLTAAEALPEVVEQGFIKLLDDVYATGQPFVGTEMPFKLYEAATGHEALSYLDFVYQPLRDDQGRTTGILAFILDSTEKVLARQASEATAQRLQLLTDALPVLISYLDREQRYRFANQSYQLWFDVDPATLLGRTIPEVVGNEAYAAVQGYINRALAGERLEFEARMPYRENFVRHIHTDYIPDVHNGEVQGFYALVTDITDQVQARERVQELNQELAAINEEMLVANEELRETNDRLSHTNVDLDTFVYTASHDLKAPISNIEGLLLALREQLPAAVANDSQVAHLLSLMHGSVARFQRTIGQLTDVSKLQQAHAEPAEAVDLAALAEAVRLDLAPALTLAHGQLTVDVGGCPTVRFSPKNLRSILYNLLSNAIKYRHPDRPPLVYLRAYCTAGQVLLEVQDNGLGLSEQQQAQLFVMFRRLHTHVEGTGVGLYMVKRMAENAGGTIRVHSRPGVGTTFTVVLPDRG